GLTLEEISSLFDGAAAPTVDAAAYEAGAHAGLKKSAFTSEVKEADGESVEK
ncbi:hypothetical protein JCM10207_006205, partial [Rhodosporidiobolus poonsookiae]